MIRVTVRVTGSQKVFMWLPRSFSYSRNLAFVCEVSKADAANTEVTEVGVRATADFAAVISTG